MLNPFFKENKNKLKKIAYNVEPVSRWLEENYFLPYV